jgi:putative DNA primase/helicase
MQISERYYNIDDLDVLVNVTTDKLPNDFETYITEEERLKLVNLLKDTKLHEEGYRYKKITYRKKQYGDIRYGRVIADTDKDDKYVESLQNMWKFIRKVASNGHIMGYDMENSQPRILLQLCERHCPGVKLNYLNAYVNHRDDIRNKIKAKYGVSTGSAKELVVRLCFGGTISEWRKDNGVDESVENLDLIKGFHGEVQHIMTKLARKFPNYARALQVFAWRMENEPEKMEGKVECRTSLAMYLQDIEGDIILSMNRALNNLGIEVLTPIHDEINVEATDYVVDNSDEIIEKLQVVVKADTGFDIKLKCEDYSMDDEVRSMLDAHRPYVNANTVDDPFAKGYSFVKEEFEKNAFMIKDTVEYAFVKSTGDIQIVKKKDFKDRFEDWSYMEVKRKKNGETCTEQVPFIDKWLKDPEKRYHTHLDLIPPPLKAPDGVYNLWNGFDIERSKVAPKDPSRVFELIKVLCNHDMNAYEYVVDWIAQMFQSPAVKTGTALCFKSKQGAGKGSLYNILEKMMGSLCKETADPLQTIFGTHGNLHIGKIFVAIDETGSGDTCKVLGKLKNIITSNKTVYNEKGLKQVVVSNFTRFMFTTNNSIPISLDGKDDRRYCIIECSSELIGPQNSDFWNDFYDQVVDDEGIIRGFYEALMMRDISGRNWRALPDTELRQEVIDVSTHPIVFWFDHWVRSHPVDQKWTPTQLFDSYRSYCAEHGINTCKNSKSFGISFRDHIEFDECGIEKTRSMHGMAYKIDRQRSFDWLKRNNYTEYDSLSVIDTEEEDC